jgi:signal transduction histidine kinase
MSVVDLSEVVRDCFALVMPYAQTRQVQLRLDKFSECLVDGDQTQLQQVVLNLLNNAIEAASESVADIKRVQVGMQRGQDQVVVSVEDNGNGISEDIQDSVFELFKSTKAEGMGVGLWLSKTVVNAHRGDIQFISKPGEGTRFEVRLPLQSGSPIGLS